MKIGNRHLEVTSVFLKIGLLGFGLAAIWGLLQSEVQERRAWMTKERFLEGMALVQTLPGATAVQMCIFAGYQRAGWLGGLLAGLAFTLPAFAIMLALTAMASACGALPWMRDAFYGLGPVVLGIFVATLVRLGRGAIRNGLALLLAVAAAALASSPLGIAFTLLLAGCAGVALHHSRRAGLVAALVVLSIAAAESYWTAVLAPAATPGAAASGLGGLALFFFKVGAVTFGGGMTIIAFVQDQVVAQMGWITNQEFIEGLTLGQFTPGPVIMVAAYVGYKVAGVAGAGVAALAIFLPSFVLMLSILPVVERVRGIAWVKAAMLGIAPAVVGAIAVSVAHLVPYAATDAFTWIMLVGTTLAMSLWRVPALPTAFGGALFGVLARRL